ncbi:MAG: CPBP family intramembrane metalloprotease [Oscillospiraceae bacterium]|jgi:membrane protease YdiL (CAAX protease family)|nr:CPBP family intramembrane metalloprotease [Oscillospiraceae bacterium]
MSDRRRSIVGMTIAAIIVIGLTVLYHAAIASIQSIPVRITSMAAIQFALFAVPYIMNGIYERQTFAALGYSNEAMGLQFTWAAGLFAILAALFVGLPALLGYDVLGERDALWFAVPYQMLLVGFSEETLFRGYFLLQLLKLTRSNAAAIIISSLMFGAWHAVGPLVSGAGLPIMQIIVTAIIGAILAVPRVYARHCTTLSAALAHGAYNSLIRILSWCL